MTRSKRARRVARREYAEKHSGKPPVRTVQPSASQGAARRTAKQKLAKPFYARPEFIRALYSVASIVAVSLMVYWLYSRQKSSASEVTPTPTVATSSANATPAPGAVVKQQYSAPPPMTIDVNKTYTATIETAKGNITAELFAKDAPQTVNNFVFLARDGFYDGLTFHRVITDFVAQGGDPNADGSGGPGYSIPDEFGPRQHIAGALAMAHTDLPNSAGSQFYITLNPQPSLDGKYTVFGQVTEGMDVVQNLTKRDPDQNPTYPGDLIKRITIEEK